MSAPQTRPDCLMSDVKLRRVVASALQRAGEKRSIVSVKRRSCAYSSSFAIEEITVGLEGGGSKSLVCKYLARESLSESACAMRPAMNHQFDRESFVYKNILAQAALGTAFCYDARRRGRPGDHSLLLEHVPGEPLYDVGTFDAWLEAARWLARAHETLRGHVGMRRPSPLARYDRICFEQWIVRAESVSHTQNVDVGEARVRIARLCEQARSAAEDIDALPTTLIHGEFYASNVLVEFSGCHTRICPIDWETAGIGCGLLDLAALSAGNWSEKQRQALSDSYFKALGPRSWLADVRELLVVLKKCRLLMAMKWIGWSPYWEPPPHHRHDWFAEAVQMACELNAAARADLGRRSISTKA
jgi:hypothetical protein